MRLALGTAWLRRAHSNACSRRGQCLMTGRSSSGEDRSWTPARGRWAPPEFRGRGRSAWRRGYASCLFSCLLACSILNCPQRRRAAASSAPRSSLLAQSNKACGPICSSTRCSETCRDGWVRQRSARSLRPHVLEWGEVLWCCARTENDAQCNDLRVGRRQRAHPFPSTRVLMTPLHV